MHVESCAIQQSAKKSSDSLWLSLSPSISTWMIRTLAKYLLFGFLCRPKSKHGIQNSHVAIKPHKVYVFCFFVCPIMLTFFLQNRHCFRNLFTLKAFWNFSDQENHLLWPCLLHTLLCVTCTFSITCHCYSLRNHVYVNCKKKMTAGILTAYKLNLWGLCPCCYGA